MPQSIHSKRIVNNHWDPGFVCDFCHGGYIRNVELRVSDSFDINGSCLVIDSSNDIFGVLTLDKLDVDVEFLEINTKLIISPTIKPSGADEIEARFANSRCSHELGEKSIQELVRIKQRCRRKVWP